MPITACQSLRILVVENHSDTRLSLIAFLEVLGHRAEAVTSLAEALQDLASAHYDVVISDIGLPDGDGWELLHRAHLSPPVYAIAMSGFGTLGDRAKSSAA